MRISGMPEVGKATQGFLLVSVLAVLAASCSSESARLGRGSDSMTTGSVSSLPQYERLVPPANVGSTGYQGLPSQPSNQAVVSRQPINTATNAGSGARMAASPVVVQNNRLPSPVAPAQTVALAQPANPAAIYNNPQGTLPSDLQNVATQRVVLRSGESLSKFAIRNGVSEQDVLRYNGLTSASQAHPGQVLTVPLASAQQTAAKSASQSQGLVPTTPSPIPFDKPQDRVAVLPSAASSRERQSVQASSAPAAHNGESGEGSYYTVKSGDSLYKIASANGVMVDSLKAANGLSSANIRIGQKLIIPTRGTITPKPVVSVQTAHGKSPSVPVKTTAASPKPYQPPVVENEVIVQEVAVRNDAGNEVPAGTGIGAYRWPANGAVVVGFGQPDGDEISEGIDISVPLGTSIKAAENGVVVYADDGLSDYGNAILLRHDDGRVTVYGYAEELKVKRGDSVQRGQTIALSGMTGKAQRPMVHFEVRDNTKAVDPMPYLNG